MTKTITSTIPEFPGTITFTPWLNLEQGYHIATALETVGTIKEGKAERLFLNNTAVLKALIACSESWSIVGQPEKPTTETFVAQPALPANQLLTWAFNELRDYYLGTKKVPNE